MVVPYGIRSLSMNKIKRKRYLICSKLRGFFCYGTLLCEIYTFFYNIKSNGRYIKLMLKYNWILLFNIKSIYLEYNALFPVYIF